jgi:hypothetical protein
VVRKVLNILVSPCAIMSHKIVIMFLSVYNIDFICLIRDSFSTGL